MVVQVQRMWKNPKQRFVHKFFSDLHNTITLLSVVPITLENEEENEIIHTYGLLDKGSEAFLIRDDVADTLKLKRRPSNLTKKRTQ